MSKDVSSVIVVEVVKSNIGQVAVSVRVATFDKKNATRYSHMLEVTEALRFPNIAFSGDVINNKANEQRV